MLSPAELKITIATLTSRKTWLLKAIKDASLDKSQREEHLEACRNIESALKKLAALTETSPSASVLTSTSIKKRKSFKVLVADDDNDSATLIMELLADLGIRDVEIANDGVDTFDKIKASKEPYDLILCDWDMPGLTGLDVHNKAKASNTLRGAHFMMVTAVSEAARIREAIQHGVSDYLVKPIDIEILEGKIKAALGELMPPPEKTS